MGDKWKAFNDKRKAFNDKREALDNMLSPTYKKYYRKFFIPLISFILCGVFIIIFDIIFGGNKTWTKTTSYIINMMMMFAVPYCGLIMGAYFFDKYSRSNNNLPYDRYGDDVINGNFLSFMGWLFCTIQASAFFIIFSYSIFFDYKNYYLTIKSKYIILALGIVKMLIMILGVKSAVKYITEDSLLRKDITLLFSVMIFIICINFSEHTILVWRWGDVSIFVLTIKFIVFTLAIFSILYFLSRRNQLIKIISDKCDVLFPNKNIVMPHNDYSLSPLERQQQLSERQQRGGRWGDKPQEPPARHTSEELIRAWLSWIILTIFVFIWGLPPLKSYLNGIFLPKFPLKVCTS